MKAQLQAMQAELQAAKQREAEQAKREKEREREIKALKEDGIQRDAQLQQHEDTTQQILKHLPTDTTDVGGSGGHTQLLVSRRTEQWRTTEGNTELGALKREQIITDRRLATLESYIAVTRETTQPSQDTPPDDPTDKAQRDALLLHKRPDFL